MPALDWFFTGVLLLSMLLGAWRGLVYELISLMGWVAALVLARLFAGDVAQHLPMAGASELLRHVLAFLLIFVAAVMAGTLLAVVFKKLLNTVGLRPADRALGALFGLSRGGLLLLLLSALVSMTAMKDAALWQESHGARIALSILATVRPMLPQDLAPYLPA